MTLQDFRIEFAQIRADHEEGLASLGDSKVRAAQLWRQSKDFMTDADREQAFEIYRNSMFYYAPERGFATTTGFAVATLLAAIYWFKYRNK